MRHAFNIYEGSTGRVRFHGTRKELVAVHAAALGLQLVQRSTGPADFESAFLGVLDELAARGVEGVIFGNIHLADVRAWYEERTTEHGFRHVEPLWGEAPGEVARELVRLGYRARIVSVDLAQGDPAWLGRDLSEELIQEMEAWGIDPAGEKGEYHTFVWDGPTLRAPVRFRVGETVEMEGHRLVDLFHVS